MTTSLSPEKPSLAKQLKAAGYQTAVFGKMHFNRPAAQGLYGFDVMMTEGELNTAWRKDVQPQAREWKPFQTPAQEWMNAAKAPYPASDEQMLGSYCTRQDIRYLEENRDKPFALWVSFQEPYSPFNFPIDDRERFAPAKMPVPRVGPDDAWQIPLIFRDLNDDEKRGNDGCLHRRPRLLPPASRAVREALRIRPGAARSLDCALAEPLRTPRSSGHD